MPKYRVIQFSREDGSILDQFVIDAESETQALQVIVEMNNFIVEEIKD